MIRPVRVAAIALATTATLALAACGGASSSSDGGAATGGDLVIARSADIIAMDKTTTFDNNSIRVMQQIMEPLFMVSQDGSKVDPWLATGYEISDDPDRVDVTTGVPGVPTASTPAASAPTTAPGPAR